MRGRPWPRGQLPLIHHSDLHRDRSDLFILVKKKKKKGTETTLHCIGLTHKLSYIRGHVCCVCLVCSAFSPEGKGLGQAPPNPPGKQPSPRWTGGVMTTTCRPSQAKPSL